ncbi:MAG: undecaprenyl-diphosphate phosphatase [Spirochaetales bacterium]|jgi:undecaprenyl-diphosphatase|nr:undecaprenyl-diphosphate phosphatase [Spirochaetales bacterium]
MTTFQAILFGCLQGLAEFLPISSSGHLVLLKSLFGLEDVPRLFDVLLHVATLFVVFAVFRRRIAELFAALGRFLLRRRQEEDAPRLRLILAIIIATFCTGVPGVFLKDLGFESRPKIVSAFLLVTAIILLVTRFLEKRESAAPEPKLPGIKEGLITGIAQGIGVLPGISRSGITISAALFAGVSRREAGEFSFLLSIPAILGALVLSLKDSGSLAAAVAPPALIAGLISAVITGYISLRFLLRLIQGGRLYLFALYLVPVGILGIIFL